MLEHCCILFYVYMLDRQKQAERRQLEETRADSYKERKRKQDIGSFKVIYCIFNDKSVN